MKKIRLANQHVVVCAVLLSLIVPPCAIAQSTTAVVANPTPAHGLKGVSLAPTLAWKSGRAVQAKGGHMVFVGTTRKEVADAFYRNHSNVQVYVVSAATVDLSALTASTTYYWRVDQINDALAPGSWKGPVWSFTTGDGSAMSVFRDDFGADLDVLAQGTADTGWDGFLGKGAQETADRVAIADGKLFMQSTRGRYQEGWNPLGPLLYKMVTGDFKATVRVVDYEKLSFNNCGIMARAADLDDAGKGEDWISIDYFPIYGGIYARMADDNRRTEKGSNGQGGKADRYLQLELVGNLFYLRHSPDGVTWKEMPNSPLTRNDLVNVPLQVGLFQATYSPNQGQVSFDDFELVRGDQIRTARLAYPADAAKETPTSMTLSWIPGGGAKYHDVYFGSLRSTVEAAESDKKSDVYKGRQAVADIDYEVSSLEDGKTYYWRVDEVGEEEIHRGEVWSFTVYDRMIADFEAFRSGRDAALAWGDSGPVGLAKDVAHSGRHSLMVLYSNSRAPYHSSAAYTFDQDQDWLSSTYGFRALRIHFKGDPQNQPSKLYMAFEDNDWGKSRTLVEYEGDPAVLQSSEWTRWDIDLQKLVANNPAFRLDHVKKMSFCVGHPDATAGAGSGKVYLDDISLEYGGQPSSPKYIQPARFVREVPFSKVAVTGGLWRERMEVNRTVSLPHVWGRCETSTKGDGKASKRLDNFRKVGGEMSGGFTGTYFNDSDVYKIIEGTANSLKNHPDPKLEAYTDSVIDSIAAAQWDDGYVFTFYSLPKKRPEARWTNVGSMHELYCAGHMFEAAVAYYRATGKRKLLDVSIRFADLICDTFAPGKREAAPGHQEIELALVKLYRVTGNERYWETAKFFVDQRGQGAKRNLYGTYSQDHVPFVAQEKGVGHSVRAGYLYCAATDIAAVNHDEAYANTLSRVWDNIISAKTYITGGIGQPGGPEGFANDYELGNGCYAETCSGIAFAMWNHRLHLMTGESKYADLIERTFLNNMLSSLSFAGDKHYYTNPLTTNGRERWEWPGHDCACCPSNLVRVISSVGGYAYSHSDDTISINQYLESEAAVTLPDNAVGLKQTTQYPWDGHIAIEVNPEVASSFHIRLRIPGWARNQPMPGNLYKYLNAGREEITLAINGAAVEVNIENGYVDLKRRWELGDTIQLYLPMPIRRVIAHPRAVADKGLVAIERGPIVYCAESQDNAFDVSRLELADDAELQDRFEKDFFSGVTTISEAKTGLKLIPYYLYANRGRSWMRVWISRKKSGQ